MNKQIKTFDVEACKLVSLFLPPPTSPRSPPHPGLLFNWTVAAARDAIPSHLTPCTHLNSQDTAW